MMGLTIGLQGYRRGPHCQTSIPGGDECAQAPAEAPAAAPAPYQVMLAFRPLPSAKAAAARHRRGLRAVAQPDTAPLSTSAPSGSSTAFAVVDGLLLHVRALPPPNTPIRFVAHTHFCPGISCLDCSWTGRIAGIFASQLSLCFCTGGGCIVYQQRYSSGIFVTSGPIAGGATAVAELGRKPDFV